MRPTITAFAASPDRGRGLARDMPVRWALEEVRIDYDVRLLSFTELKQPTHRLLQPFGQIPTYQDGGIELFESGAIVLHIAQHNPGLLPDDPGERARSITWLFAALNTIEPPIVEREQVRFQEQDQSWYDARLPLIDGRIHSRLTQLSDCLGREEWLGKDFSAGDLMMVTVLRRLEGVGIADDFDNLRDYVDRATQRPAFRRAFDDQLAVFAAVKRKLP